MWPMRKDGAADASDDNAEAGGGDEDENDEDDADEDVADGIVMMGQLFALVRQCHSVARTGGVALAGSPSPRCAYCSPAASHRLL